MSDGETDIRILALRRQQERRQSRVSSGHSAYEATPLKEYKRKDSSRSNSRRNSYVEVLNSTPRLLEDDVQIGRMHVPPVIVCECNGTEAFAHISSSEPVSTMSTNFVKKLRLQDQVVADAGHVFDTFSLHQRELKGKVKYIDLSIGSTWQQVAQFNIVENHVTDITLGIDFLRKTQSVLNFEDSSIVVGGISRGERIPFLNSREVMFLARRTNANKTNLFNGNRTRELL